MSQITDALIQRAIQVLGITPTQYDMAYQPPGYPTGAEPWRNQLMDYADLMNAAMTTTDVTAAEVDSLNADSAFQYVKATYVHIQNVGGELLKAIEHGDFSRTITTIPRMQLRASVVAIFVYNMSGVQLHLSGAFTRGIAAGRITDAQAVAHLNRCMDICLAFGALADKKALSLIDRPKSSTSGLGVMGWDDLAVLAIVGVLAVVLLLGVLFIIAWAYNQHYIQKRALDECDKLLEQGDQVGADKCRANVANASNQALNTMLSNLMSPLQIVGYTAAGALALYVGVKYIWPAVTESRSSHRALGGT